MHLFVVFTPLCRGWGVNELSHEHSDFTAFGSKKSCLRARAFERHNFFCFIYTIYSLINLKNNHFKSKMSHNGKWGKKSVIKCHLLLFELPLKKGKKIFKFFHV